MWIPKTKQVFMQEVKIEYSSLFFIFLKKISEKENCWSILVWETKNGSMTSLSEWWKHVEQAHVENLILVFWGKEN